MYMRVLHLVGCLLRIYLRLADREVLPDLAFLRD